MREEDIARAVCQEHLKAFSIAAFPVIDPGTRYLQNWHIDAICEHLHAVHDGAIKRLIINLPPRSVKSFLASICFPAWLLGKDPAERIFCASENMKLAGRLSADCRSLVESDTYRMIFPETRLAHDQNQKLYFATTKKGYRMSVSVGSNPVGEGGKYLIVDDPNNPDERSDEILEATNNWFTKTFMGRINNKDMNSPQGGRVVVIQQRLNPKDLTGHLLESGGWHLLKLPAYATQKTIVSLRGIYEKGDEFEWEMMPGEYLHPEREGAEVINQIRREQGETALVTQWLQEPQPAGGGELKITDVQTYNSYADIGFKKMNIYILCDAANEKKKQSDYTVFAVLGLAPDKNYFLLDMLREKLNPTERVEYLMKLHRKWTARAGKPPMVCYEQYGMMTDTHYLKVEQTKQNYRFAIKEVGGQMNKNDRIRRLIPIFETKRFYIPDALIYDGRDITQEFLNEEIKYFPYGKHDDMLDAISRIFDAEPVWPSVKKLEVKISSDKFISKKPRKTGGGWLSYQ